MSLRSPGMEKAYKEASLPGLLNETPLKVWKYWRVVEAAFPHDKIADVDHILLLNRKCEIEEIKPYEYSELLSIIQEIQNAYDCVLFNLPRMRSVWDIPHLHIYKLKRECQ